MKKSLYLIATLAFLVLWSSCRKDFDLAHFDLAPSTGNLQFSKDTVYLDTVFTNIGSSTYNLKVYNRTGNDISIPTIRLGLGEALKTVSLFLLKPLSILIIYQIQMVSFYIQMLLNLILAATSKRLNW